MSENACDKYATTLPHQLVWIGVEVWKKSLKTTSTPPPYRGVGCGVV